MAFTYQNKTWSMEGEVNFQDQMTLLNPTMAVRQVTIVDNMVYINVILNENGGVYEHQFNLQYDNASGTTDIDVVVESAVQAVFPGAISA
jgi:hypothetical protein